MDHNTVEAAQNGRPEFETPVEILRRYGWPDDDLEKVLARLNEAAGDDDRE